MTGRQTARRRHAVRRLAMVERSPDPRDALALSEACLESIADRAEIGYWHWDVVADVLQWSPRCRQLFAVADGETIDYARFLAALHPDDRARADRAVRASLAGDAGRNYDVEFRTRRPDGTVRWIRARGSAAFEVRGSADCARDPVPEQRSATSLAGIVLDVTA